jgi:hypothetical protein
VEVTKDALASLTVNTSLRDELCKVAVDAATHKAHQLADALRATANEAAPRLADIHSLAGELHGIVKITHGTAAFGSCPDATAIEALKEAYENASPAQRLALLPLRNSILGTINRGTWLYRAFVDMAEVCDLRDNAMLRETSGFCKDVVDSDSTTYSLNRNVIDCHSDFSGALELLAAFNATLQWASVEALDSFLPVFAHFVSVLASVISNSKAVLLSVRKGTGSQADVADV